MHQQYWCVVDMESAAKVSASGCKGARLALQRRGWYFGTAGPACRNSKASGCEGWSVGGTGRGSGVRSGDVQHVGSRSPPITIQSSHAPPDTVALAPSRMVQASPSSRRRSSPSRWTCGGATGRRRSRRRAPPPTCSRAAGPASTSRLGAGGQRGRAADVLGMLWKERAAQGWYPQAPPVGWPCACQQGPMPLSLLVSPHHVRSFLLRSSFEPQALVDNIHAALVGAVQHIPKKWSNVQVGWGG